MNECLTLMTYCQQVMTVCVVDGNGGCGVAASVSIRVNYMSSTRSGCFEKAFGCMCVTIV